jgi:uncharacterized membrane protein
MTMQKYRIEGLSDLVFGLALSIGSLAMISQPVNNLADITDGLVQFIFGFLIIVSVWVSYTHIMSEHKVETVWDFRLNLALLMLVAMEPYLLYLLGHNDPNVLAWSSSAYAVDIGLIMLILAGFYARKDGEGLSQENIEQNRFERDRFIVISLIFLVSALPFFWVQSAVHTINLRFIIWMCAILPGLAIRVMYRRKRSRSAG